MLDHYNLLFELDGDLHDRRENHDERAVLFAGRDLGTKRLHDLGRSQETVKVAQNQDGCAVRCRQGIQGPNGSQGIGSAGRVARSLAQAAMTVVSRAEPPVFENVRFDRPVSIPKERSLTIRLAALVRQAGLIEVVLKSESTGFQADHFRALCRFDRVEPEILSGLNLRKNEEVLPLDLAKDLYGSILFQRGRFTVCETTGTFAPRSAWPRWLQRNRESGFRRPALRVGARRRGRARRRDPLDPGLHPP
jgi:hypothetical protein